MSIINYVPLFSILISTTALVYSFLSNTKRYELTYQHYKDVLAWYEKCIEVILYLRLNPHAADKNEKLSKLSALIETGRFYFPNIDTGDNYGADKAKAYRGHRNVILDFLVYEFEIFKREDCGKFEQHSEILQRHFTSHVFRYLDPKQQKNKIKSNTAFNLDSDMTIDKFLLKNCDAIDKILEELGQ